MVLEHKKAVIYGAGGAFVAEAAEVDALDEDAIEKHMDDAECPLGAISGGRLPRSAQLWKYPRGQWTRCLSQSCYLLRAGAT